MVNIRQYRAKRIDNGEWIYGYLLKGVDCLSAHWYIETVPDNPDDTHNAYEVDPETIGQEIGLKDKNGKEIYENDIVSCVEFECYGYIAWNESESGYFFNVLYEDGCYKEEHIYDYIEHMENVGNVTDNPELLER